VRGCVLLEVRLPFDNIFCVGEGGVQSTLFCIFTHCYFISSPSKLKICHTIKQLYINNIMAKHENNALQKKFYNQFKRILFCRMCPMPGTHLTWAWCAPDRSINVRLHTLHNNHVISHVKHALADCLSTFFSFELPTITAWQNKFVWLSNIKWNQCSMLKFMLYHTNITCLLAHNKPKIAQRLELFCTAFQYNPSSFTLFRLT